MLLISFVQIAFHIFDMLTDVVYVAQTPKYNFAMLLALIIFILPPIPMAMMVSNEGGWSVNPFIDFFLILTGTQGLVELLKIWDDPNKWTTTDSEFAQFRNGASF